MKRELWGSVLVLIGMGAALSAQDASTSARDLAHDAHHAWAKRRGYARPDGSKGAGPSVLSSFSAGATVSLRDYSCRAAAIATVKINEARPVVSPDGALIFTDYSVVVVATHKGFAPPLITRVGGEILSGAPRRFRSSLLPLLVPGETYILFLSAVLGSDALAADFPGGTLRLLPDGRAEQVDGVGFLRGLPKSGQSTPASVLFSEIDLAVSSGCAQ